MLRQGMIERFKKAAPMIGELVDDLEWIQNEFNPEKATEEERTYAKYLLSLGSNCFDESDWRLKRMFAAIGQQGRLIRNKAGRLEWKAQMLNSRVVVVVRSMRRTSQMKKNG